MAKRILELTLRDNVDSPLNFATEDGTQSYRVTAEQIKDFILAAGNISRDMITAEQRLPIGMVSSFAGIVAPSGWIFCDGSAISRTTYSNLFDVIGVAHGSGDGSTTFNLPDYRGRFLRGVDGGIARDPNRATRTAMNSGGNTGDNIGSVQSDAFQGHYHNTWGSTSGGSFQRFDVPALDRSAAGNGAQTNIVAKTIITDGTNGTPRISSETRPINAYVNYIIKF